MVLLDTDEHHGLLAPVRGHLANEVLDALDAHAAQFFPLAVHEVEGLIRTELDLGIPLGVVVEPLLHAHLIHRLAVVVLLPLGLDLPPA